MVELYSVAKDNVNANKFDELLKALKGGNEKLVNDLAYKLFVGEDGKTDHQLVKAFEAFADCRVTLIKEKYARTDHNTDGWIRHNKKLFFFGKEEYDGDPE